MFVVIFEVQPKRERWDEYLETARLLRPELERIDGFLDNERFRSERTEGRVLSLSTWRDEKALIRWRTQATHHSEGQRRGRDEIFADYHLRVGEVVADTAAPAEVTLGGQRFDVTEVGAAPSVTIVEIPPGVDGHGAHLAGGSGLAPADGTPGLVDWERFGSITEEGKRLLLCAWADDAAAERGAQFDVNGVSAGVRQRRVRIIRDYGLRDRREAPQYFPDVL